MAKTKTMMLAMALLGPTAWLLAKSQTKPHTRAHANAKITVQSSEARPYNGCLYISGHTHSGWQAPNLVFTEQTGRYPVTHINLMSPWFTGYDKEPARNAESSSFEFFIDEPDIVVSFAFRVYRNFVAIRLRNHRENTWMAQWQVPLA
jgi:hypothetical protein